MEIFTLLETLEDILENSKNLPLVNKAMVDKDEMLEIIKEIRIKLPDELKQAKWIKEERQRILVEAQKEADGIVKEHCCSYRLKLFMGDGRLVRHGAHVTEL